MTSQTIVDLLADKHHRDLFVGECKDGPTHTASHRRLDAWAMRRSWVRPLYSGYEVKVSRSDWLRDQKLLDYLPLCHELWVVAPMGVVKSEELPDKVGLLVVASTGTRLLTKRRAVYREIDPPVDLLHYVLMCRTKIVRNTQWDEPDTRADRAKRWELALQEEDAINALGYKVTRRLREQTVERVRKAEERAQVAESQLKQLQGAADILKELGLHPGVWDMRRSIERAMDVTAPLRSELRRVLGEIDKLESLAKWKGVE